VRSARPEDAADFLAYLRAVVPESDFLIVRPEEVEKTVDEERRWIEERLDAPGRLIPVAEASQRLIGALTFDNGSRRRVAHRGTFGMTVRKNWRAQGVGTALLQCLIDWAEESPLIEKVRLGVFSGNDVAVRMYRKSGFVEEGRRPREVKIGENQYADVILMYRFV